MNREIKFKVWDNEYKEYSNWTNRDPFFCVSNGKLFFWEKTKDEDGKYCEDIILEDNNDRFTLLQYTGFKDKNGKEIYEGDIICFENQEGVWLDQVDRNIEVKYPFICGTAHLGEVIGNIFENPELLK